MEVSTVWNLLSNLPRQWTKLRGWKVIFFCAPENIQTTCIKQNHTDKMGQTLSEYLDKITRAPFYMYSAVKNLLSWNLNLPLSEKAHWLLFKRLLNTHNVLRWILYDHYVLGAPEIPQLETKLSEN